MSKLIMEFDVLQARVTALEAELRRTSCPRPCNNRPDEFSVGDCVDAGECGCRHGAALLKEPQ